MLPLLVMRPLYVDKLWGGARLFSLAGKAQHARVGRVGEAWEVADLDEGTSTVASGPLAGQTLKALVRSHGAALVGTPRVVDTQGQPRFPLLVKLIDADDDLSVQVHPDQAYSDGHPGTHSKDEAWLVLAADASARMLVGLLPGTTRAQFAEAIALGTAHTLLVAQPARAGDIVRIAPGTVHAIGKGCLLLEVQEPSDTTFRVFDYNRTDDKGQRRSLHIEQALAVMRTDSDAQSDTAFAQSNDVLVAQQRLCTSTTPVRALSTRRYTLGVISDATCSLLPCGEPRIVCVTAGSAVFDDGDATYTLHHGTCAIVPPQRTVHIQAQHAAHIAVMVP